MRLVLIFSLLSLKKKVNHFLTCWTISLKQPCIRSHVVAVHWNQLNCVHFPHIDSVRCLQYSVSVWKKGISKICLCLTVASPSSLLFCYNSQGSFSWSIRIWTIFWDYSCSGQPSKYKIVLILEKKNTKIVLFSVRLCGGWGLQTMCQAMAHLVFKSRWSQCRHDAGTVTV